MKRFIVPSLILSCLGLWQCSPAPAPGPVAPSQTAVPAPQASPTGSLTPIPAEATSPVASPIPALLPTELPAPQATTVAPVPAVSAPSVSEILSNLLPAGYPVIVHGQNLSGTRKVLFKDQREAEFAVKNDQTLLVTVPSKAAEGPIMVVTDGGTALSAKSFIPMPEGLVAWWPAEMDASDRLGKHSGTLQGAAFAPGKADNAFSFDGVGDSVSLKPDPGLELDSFTWEGWIRVSSTDTGTIYQYMPKGGLTAGSGFIVDVFKNQFRCQKGNGSQGFDTVTSTSILKSFVWYHTACVLQRSGGASILTLYLDGQAESTYSIPSKSGVFYSDGQGTNPPEKSALIGAAANSNAVLGFNGFFQGRLDELHLFNRALSGGEIQALQRAHQ